jgi:hypothetical protein
MTLLASIFGTFLCRRSTCTETGDEVRLSPLHKFKLSQRESEKDGVIHFEWVQQSSNKEPKCPSFLSATPRDKENLLTCQGPSFALLLLTELLASTSEFLKNYDNANMNESFPCLTSDY